MEFDDITFTEWQIDKIRVALGKYRIANARNGRLIAWSRVRDEITNSDVNIDHYSEDDAELVFKHETLRRFFARTSVLELEKLKDLTRFLLHEAILDLKDMEEGDIELKKMLAAHEYLATTSDSAKIFLAKVEGVYTASMQNEVNFWENFTLRIIADPSREFVRVEEVYELSSEELSTCKTFKERSLFTNLRVTKIGYGFSVTKGNFLHIFLTGQESGVCIAYVQTGPVFLYDSSHEKPRAYINLIRHGDDRHLIDCEGKPLRDGRDELIFSGVERAETNATI